MQRSKFIQCPEYSCGHVFSHEELVGAQARVDRNLHTGQEKGASELRCPRCRHFIWVLS